MKCAVKLKLSKQLGNPTISREAPDLRTIHRGLKRCGLQLSERGGGFVDFPGISPIHNAIENKSCALYWHCKSAGHVADKVGCTRVSGAHGLDQSDHFVSVFTKCALFTCHLQENINNVKQKSENKNKFLKANVFRKTLIEQSD